FMPTGIIFYANGHYILCQRALYFMPTLKAKKNGTFPLPHKAKTALPKKRVYSIDSVNFIEYRRKIFLRAYTALKNFADTHQQKGKGRYNHKVISYSYNM
ncbi:MAG: hypothetical protein IJQ16_07220, partial [Selenomonadaceae bacterium]|nr:hypothetical protein [Selenomonadaceae bacterium]